MLNDFVRIERRALEAFCGRVFQSLRLNDVESEAAAAVLVAADARGIPSHGVARLQRYVEGLDRGAMVPDAPVEVLRETPVSIVLDAHGSMGAPVSIRAMENVISKAQTAGQAFACVRDSNHFGIAGYYAMMALPENMIGIAMTNTAALGVPTFGRRVMYGTNPLAFAAPAAQEGAFVLDMSTTVVTRGKIEMFKRSGKRLPQGWAVDKTGRSATDPRSLLDDMFHRAGGGILPLGGESERFGGHKGYGLAVMVDILCAVLCGAPFGPAVTDSETYPGRVSHFFGAIKIDNFRDPEEFRSDMDRMLRSLRDCPLATGAERVWFAGLKELEKEEECRRIGVPVLEKAYEDIARIGRLRDVDPPPVLK